MPGSELVPKKEEAKKELSKRDDDKKPTTGETLTIQVKIDETKDSTKYTALLEKVCLTNRTWNVKLIYDNNMTV